VQSHKFKHQYHQGEREREGKGDIKEERRRGWKRDREREGERESSLCRLKALLCLQIAGIIVKGHYSR
jgi:hypothetical protein